VEWETDRMRFLGRGRGPDDPIALDGRALSGTTGAVLDPILSLRTRLRLAPPPLPPPLPRDGRRGGRDRRSRPGAEVSRPRRRRPHVRAGLHARASLAPAPGYLRRGGPALRAARLPRLLLRRVAAR